MMDTIRTTEQKKADELLYDAIRHCLDVYGILDDFVISDYTILLATQKISPEGVVITSHPILFRDGDIPWYRALGLIEIHRMIAKHQLIDPDNNG